MIEYIDEIYEHFANEYPREGCGILCVRKGRLEWEPCKNAAKSDEDFVIDSNQYFKIKATSDIVGIVHSHPDASCEPSEYDINTCNALGIRYYIFSYPSMDMHIVEPETRTTELYGREYEFGVSDCFEAARDYYRSIGLELPQRDMYEDDWWEKGLDYFNPEYIKSWGFNPVEDIQKNDLLIFAVGSEVGNHCGIYLGDEIIYHHAVNRLSCRESLHPLWGKSIIGIYRYAA